MLHFYRILWKWCLRSSNNGLYALSSLLIRKIRRIRLQFWITLESGKINIPVTKNNEWDSSEFNLFNIYHYYSYYFYMKQCKYCFKNVVKSKWYGGYVFLWKNSVIYDVLLNYLISMQDSDSVDVIRHLYSCYLWLYISFVHDNYNIKIMQNSDEYAVNCPVTVEVTK